MLVEFRIYLILYKVSHHKVNVATYNCQNVFFRFIWSKTRILILSKFGSYFHSVPSRLISQRYSFSFTKLVRYWIEWFLFNMNKFIEFLISMPWNVQNNVLCQFLNTYKEYEIQISILFCFPKLNVSCKLKKTFLCTNVHKEILHHIVRIQICLLKYISPVSLKKENTIRFIY